MNLEIEDQSLHNKASEAFDGCQKSSKISYTREFLLSVSELEICKELPKGFDRRVLGEFEDTSHDIQERPRIHGGLPLQGFRRGDYGSSPPTRGDSSNYSRGIYGRWDNRSSGRSDKDSDSHSDLDSDFYISDMKSGIRALVKAGPDCKVIPLIVESRLVNTSGKCKALSNNLRKWLRDRNLPDEARLLRLEEGYVKEGSYVSVIGRFLRNSDAMMIVQPSELLTTGCLCRKLLLPVDIDGLILGVPKTAGTLTHSNSAQCVDQ